MKISHLLLALSSTALLTADTTPPSEGPNSKVNYPANFQVEGGMDIYLQGEYLYWGPQSDNLAFTQTANSLKKINPSFDSGFRVGLGFNFPKSGFELAGYWTSFNTTSTKSVNSPNTPLAPIPAANSAHAKWTLNLDLADLEWGRDSWFGGHFALKPFMSIRAALIDDHLKATFKNNSSSTLKRYAEFRGGGLRGGGQGRWTFGQNFALYGLFSYSLLYGDFDAKLTLPDATSKDSWRQTLSSLQTGAGLSWDTHFANNRLHIALNIGWEQNIFFHFNQFPNYTSLTPTFFTQDNGNLSLQGLTVGGRFDF